MLSRLDMEQREFLVCVCVATPQLVLDDVFFNMSLNVCIRNIIVSCR